MKITEVINVLTLIMGEHGDLEVEVLEKTENNGIIPKNGYDIGICILDGHKFVDISDVWGDDE